MPYYSELGIYTSPSSSYSPSFLKGPYANHSSIIASNLGLPARPVRAFKPHLTTISEGNRGRSPLRRINSPNSTLLALQPRRVIKQYDTADIDVSVNKYRGKADPKGDEKAVAKEDNKAPTKKEEKDATPNTEIRRDRATVRLKTVHRDTPSEDGVNKTRTWRDNFSPNELKTEAKVRKKSPGEILKEKFLIRSRSKENFLGDDNKKPAKKKTLKKSPSFHDICKAISSDSVFEDLNPRKNSKTDVLQEEILDHLSNVANSSNNTQDGELDEETETLKRRPSAKVSKGKPYVHRKSTLKDLLEQEPNLNITEADELESKLTVKRRPSVKLSSEKIVKKEKPKPIITASVGEIEEKIKPNLKVYVEEIHVSESPKPKKERKFTFSVVVEEARKESIKRNRLKLPKSKKKIVATLSPKKTAACVGKILNEKQHVPKVSEVNKEETAVARSTDDGDLVENLKDTNTEGTIQEVSKVVDETQQQLSKIETVHNCDVNAKIEASENTLAKSKSGSLKTKEPATESDALFKSNLISNKSDSVEESTPEEDNEKTGSFEQPKSNLENKLILTKSQSTPKLLNETAIRNFRSESPKTVDDSKPVEKSSSDTKLIDTKPVTEKVEKGKSKSENNSVLSKRKLWDKPQSHSFEKEGNWRTKSNKLQDSVEVDQKSGPTEVKNESKSENNSVLSKLKLWDKSQSNSFEKDGSKESWRNKLEDSVIVDQKPEFTEPKTELEKSERDTKTPESREDSALNNSEINESKSENNSVLSKLKLWEKPRTNSFEKEGSSKRIWRVKPNKLEDSSTKNFEVDQKLEPTEARTDFSQPIESDTKTPELRDVTKSEKDESKSENNSVLSKRNLWEKPQSDSFEKEESWGAKTNKLEDSIEIDQKPEPNLENYTKTPETKHNSAATKTEKDPPTELNPITDSEVVPQEEAIQLKVVSKLSLIKKANKDDPDLDGLFDPPEMEQNIEPEQPEPVEEDNGFVPLQSNRFSQWMHPWKKPQQLDKCPVELFARPKVIRARHIPKRYRNQGDVEESSEEESSDEEEETEDEESEETESGSLGSSGSGKGREAPPSSAPCPADNPAFALDGAATPPPAPDEGAEGGGAGGACPAAAKYAASSTYGAFRRTGRVTPPATTIPRFRKYCVDDFNFLKVLGKGNFGKVLLAELKGTDYYYAVKCLKKDVVLEDDDIECTLIERKVLALGTKHPYLCHLLCTFQTDSHLFFVMEYLNGGDLMFHIQNTRRFSEERARFYGAEILSGLRFLHNKGIVYRDLKLDNILLDFDGHARIADFGMCKLQIFLDRMADTFCGTPDYMAPEIIKGQHYNQCVDWWSFGVLLYEMLIGSSPFSGCDEDELFWSICNEKPVIPKFLSKEANSILVQLMEKDANSRLGNRYSPYGDIQDHIFFRSIDWQALEERKLEPPFKPDLKHPLDTQYFDKIFTKEPAKLTPIETTIMTSMDQAQFQGFSYTNPNATDV